MQRRVIIVSACDPSIQAQGKDPQSRPVATIKAKRSVLTAACASVDGTAKGRVLKPENRRLARHGYGSAGPLCSEGDRMLSRGRQQPIILLHHSPSSYLMAGNERHRTAKKGIERRGGDRVANAHEPQKFSSFLRLETRLTCSSQARCCVHDHAYDCACAAFESIV